MGMSLIVRDEVWYPAEHGLSVGDTIDVALVGGGGRGGINGNSTGTNSGGTTYFGSYASAKGGAGARGGYAVSCVQPFCGGGGGYIPASPEQGGQGVVIQGSATYTTLGQALGNGGGARLGAFGILGKGAANSGGGSVIIAPNCAEGGSGYGAGGAAYNANSNSAVNCYAGNAGEIKYISHVITKDDYENGIPVTIGGGYNNISYPLALVYGKTAPTSGWGTMKGADLAYFEDFKKLVSSDTTRFHFTSQLADETMLFNSGALAINATTSYAATHFKLKNDNNLYRCNVYFKNYQSNRFMYVCGDYYVQLWSAPGSGINAKQLYVAWNRRDTILSANKTEGVDYGLITYAADYTTNNSYFSSNASGVIFNNTIVWSSGNAQWAGEYMYVFKDWTPDMKISDAKRLNGNALYYVGYAQNGYLVPYSVSTDKTALYVAFLQGIQSTGNTATAKTGFQFTSSNVEEADITSYTNVSINAPQSTNAFIVDAEGFMTHYSAMHFSSASTLGNSAVYYDFVPLGSWPESDSQPNYIYYYVDGTLQHVTYPYRLTTDAARAYSHILSYWDAEQGGIRYALSNSSTLDVTVTPVGYAGASGANGSSTTTPGGGAGGCCHIMW